MDREKVIKGLECCKWSRQNVKPEKNKCDECPYKDQGIMNAFSVWRSCTNVLARDALALLELERKVRKYYVEKCDELCSLAKSRVEVIRCKDCNNRECDGRAGTIVCGITGFSHSRLWYCADGERRDGEAE